MNDLEQIWKTTLAQIEVKIDSPAQFKTWFKDTRLIEIKDDLADIGVKNSYSADWLGRKHHDMIKDTISYIYGQEVKIKFTVDKELSNVPTEKVSLNELAREKPILSVVGGTDFSIRDAIQKSGLNPKYTFSTYIVGDNNNLAHAAAIAISENPGTIYNPLFIHGKTGLGKTHLAQAVGRHVLDKDPSKKIYYVASETFLNDLIKSIQTGQNAEFRRRFRTVDVLIIDDIQLISKWPKTQIEFFNTFNVLYNDQKQIILISDVSPDRLNDIDERLKSRFQGGMVVEINKPDFETRLAIVQKKAQIMSVNIPSRVIEYIAKEVSDNIRELEGSLQKLALYNSMVQTELSHEEVAKILGKDARSQREKVKVPRILKKIAEEYDVSVKDLKGPKRTSQLAFARQVAMYILREIFQYKLEQIAAFLNKKDHTTVIHAVDKIQSKILIDEGFKEQINLLVEGIREGSDE